jgi:hypothetical protein
VRRRSDLIESDAAIAKRLEHGLFDDLNPVGRHFARYVAQQDRQRLGFFFSA